MKESEFTSMCLGLGSSLLIIVPDKETNNLLITRSINPQVLAWRLGETAVNPATIRNKFFIAAHHDAAAIEMETQSRAAQAAKRNL